MALAPPVNGRDVLFGGDDFVGEGDWGCAKGRVGGQQEAFAVVDGIGCEQQGAADRGEVEGAGAVREGSRCAGPGE